MDKLEKQRSNSDYMHQTKYQDEKNKNEVKEINRNTTNTMNYLDNDRREYEEYAEKLKKEDNFAVKYIKNIINQL